MLARSEMSHRAIRHTSFTRFLKTLHEAPLWIVPSPCAYHGHVQSLALRNISARNVLRCAVQNPSTSCSALRYRRHTPDTERTVSVWPSGHSSSWNYHTKPSSHEMFHFAQFWYSVGDLTVATRARENGGRVSARDKFNNSRAFLNVVGTESIRGCSAGLGPFPDRFHFFRA